MNELSLLDQKLQWHLGRHSSWLCGMIPHCVPALNASGLPHIGANPKSSSYHQLFLAVLGVGDSTAPG